MWFVKNLSNGGKNGLRAGTKENTVAKNVEKIDEKYICNTTTPIV